MLSKEGLIPEIGTDITFSLYVHLEEIQFFTFHANSVLGRSLTYFPMVNGTGGAPTNSRFSLFGHVVALVTV